LIEREKRPKTATTNSLKKFNKKVYKVHHRRMFAYIRHTCT
jgi:hypothetical protein